MDLKPVVDFDPAMLECPRCGHVGVRLPYRAGKRTQHLQRCKHCGYIAAFTSFERVDTPPE